MRSLKLILIAILLVTVGFSFVAARKKNKAGKIKNGIFCDKKYDYCLTIPDTWDASVKKDKFKTRIVLTKKRYDIPFEFNHAPTYTRIPKATLYVDTTSMVVNHFIDSLLSDNFKSKQKNKILDEMPVFFDENDDFEEKARTKVKIGDVDGYLLTGERRYTLQVQRAGVNADRADHITNYYGGSILFVKRNENIYIIHFICEKQFYVNEEKDFRALLKGLEFK